MLQHKIASPLHARGQMRRLTCTAAAQPAGFGKAVVKKTTKPAVKEVAVPDGWKLVGDTSSFFIDSKGQERQVKAW